LCRKLSRAGFPRPLHQGPLAYADAISTGRPDLARGVQDLLARYAQLRYGAPAADEDYMAEVRDFERTAASLSIQKVL